ncbi:MAG: cation transporter [Akkermansiaceae bacterium]|nr:cation transporter [Akkermansiaceae bacterium]
MTADMKKTVAAVSSVVWSALLTVMKFIVGIITGSLGILSEALHSALDLLAALGSLVAVRIAARPADDEHPYGHGKVENLMALVETLLLLATAAWVVKEAVNRLLSDSPEALHVETSIWAFAVVIVSLVVDINRSAMLKRIAKETKSAALEADAAHFASDIWSSAAVLLGITGAACVGFTQEGTTLHWLLLRADVLASLGVVLLILHICRELGVKAINNLMDKANSETAEKILALMKTRMPAYRVTRLRAREVGMKVYTEIEVAVPQELHIDTAHEIADAIEELIASLFADAETIVHMQPGAMPEDTPELLIRRIALTHRFGIHGLVLMQAEQGLIIFADLELPAHATLEGWHVAIQAFRSEVQRKLNAQSVIVHVEPDVRELPAYTPDIPPDWEKQVRQAMIHLGAPLPTSIQLYTQGQHRLCIVSIPTEYSLNVQESHNRISSINKRLREQLPNIARIIVTYE